MTSQYSFSGCDVSVFWVWRAAGLGGEPPSPRPPVSPDLLLSMKKIKSQAGSPWQGHCRPHPDRCPKQGCIDITLWCHSIHLLIEIGHAHTGARTSYRWWWCASDDGVCVEVSVKFTLQLTLPESDVLCECTLPRGCSKDVGCSKRIRCIVKHFMVLFKQLQCGINTVSRK